MFLIVQFRTEIIVIFCGIRRLTLFDFQAALMNGCELKNLVRRAESQ